MLHAEDFEQAPVNVSVWEAATYGRQIILDNTQVLEDAAHALDRQREKVAASDALLKKAKKGQAVKPSYTPSTMEVVSGEGLMENIEHKFEGDETEIYVEQKEQERFSHLKTEILETYRQRTKEGVPLGSSLPHLTPDQPNRVAHVTSSRVVGQAVADGKNYVVHERFHQDQGPRNKNEPSHDRFFATDADGVVFPVVGVFKQPATKDGHSLEVLWQATVGMDRSERSDKRAVVPLLNSKVHQFVEWTVETGQRSNNRPPLSPRSQRRTLPDTGYMSVGKQHKTRK